MPLFKLAGHMYLRWAARFLGAAVRIQVVQEVEPSKSEQFIVLQIVKAP